MIGNFLTKYKSLIIIIGVIAILIPVVLFFVSSVSNSGKISDILPTPMEQVEPTGTNDIVYDFDLKVGAPVVVPGTNLEIELMSIAGGQVEGCIDCISSTIVEVRDGGNIQVWDYSCGGFSGACNYQFKQSGYIIEAQELKSDSLLIKVFPE